MQMFHIRVNVASARRSGGVSCEMKMFLSIIITVIAQFRKSYSDWDDVLLPFKVQMGLMIGE